MVETPQEKARWLKEYPAARQGGEGDRIYLEDYFSRESIEIDKLLYLALKHRAIPIWRREKLVQVYHKIREKTTGFGDLWAFEEYSDYFPIFPKSPRTSSRIDWLAIVVRKPESGKIDGFIAMLREES